MGKGSKPQKDPNLERQKKEAEARAKEDKAREDKRNADEESARKRGLRGARSLLSGNFVGFKFSSNENDNSTLGSG